MNTEPKFSSKRKQARALGGQVVQIRVIPASVQTEPYFPMRIQMSKSFESLE
jgi:hypothetical protein